MKQSIWKRKFKLTSAKTDAKINKFLAPIAILIVIVSIGFLFVGSIQSVYQSFRCDSRGMIWVATPPSRLGTETRMTQRPLTEGKYKNWYKEKYIMGYCVSEFAPMR